MRKNRMRVLPALLAVLMICTLLTGVLAANSLVSMEDTTTTPVATLSIPAIPEGQDTPGSAQTSAAVLSASKSQTSETAYASVAVYSAANNQTVGSAQTSAAVYSATGRESASASVFQLDSVIRDSKTVWSGETDIDIFSITYDNASGATTVESAYGDKVIAPGTSDQYYFRIENTGSVSVDYSMTAEGDATFTMDGVKYTIPVEVKLSNSAGKYLAGSADTWANVDDLDQVSDSGVLSAGHYTQYTLDWQWPYEQEDVEAGDAFDTMLGNLAASGEELTVTIRFMVTASNDEEADASGGEPISDIAEGSATAASTASPKTGDGSYIILWLVLMILCLCAVIFLLLGRRRDEDEE